MYTQTWLADLVTAGCHLNTRVNVHIHIHHSSLTELDLRWNFSGNKDDYVEEALMDLERFCSRNLALAVQSYAQRLAENVGGHVVHAGGGKKPVPVQTIYSHTHTHTHRHTHTHTY